MIDTIVMFAVFAGFGIGAGAVIALALAWLMRVFLADVRRVLALFLCGMPAPLLFTGFGIDAWLEMVTDTRDDMAPLSVAAFMIMTPAAAAAAFVVASLVLQDRRGRPRSTPN